MKTTDWEAITPGAIISASQYVDGRLVKTRTLKVTAKDQFELATRNATDNRRAHLRFRSAVGNKPRNGTHYELVSTAVVPVKTLVQSGDNIKFLKRVGAIDFGYVVRGSDHANEIFYDDTTKRFFCVMRTSNAHPDSFALNAWEVSFLRQYPNAFVMLDETEEPRVVQFGKLQTKPTLTDDPRYKVFYKPDALATLPLETLAAQSVISA